MNVLDVQGLTVDFPTKECTYHVLKNVDLSIEKGEVVALIGESGSGKSTLAMTILDLNSHNRKISGSIHFMGKELRHTNKERMRELRGRHIGFVPQSSMNALNPLVRIREQFYETIKAHMDIPAHQMDELTKKTLKMVAIDSARANSFPYEFSGGQRQRIMIALSMLLSPELIIADEPTTALDATIKLKMIGLLKDVVQQKNTSMLVISHDLHTISRICDRIYIMYAGRIVEKGSMKQIMKHPQHPYTQKLLASRLPLTDEPVKIESISGKPPSTLIEYSRCEFYEMCDKASLICQTKRPLKCTGKVRVSCHLGEKHE